MHIKSYQYERSTAIVYQLIIVDYISICVLSLFLPKLDSCHCWSPQSNELCLAFSAPLRLNTQVVYENMTPTTIQANQESSIQITQSQVGSSASLSSNQLDSTFPSHQQQVPFMAASCIVGTVHSHLTLDTTMAYAARRHR